MPLTLEPNVIALRLGLTVLAGLLIGINRGEHGRPAGLRTTLLVCLAASVSMIQANLLLGTAGKTPTSFVMLDLMRLPLGILSGMGFIGAGAIVRKGSFVLGVTTAATLWFVTIIGLCFGGGQIGLGLTALVLGLIVLWFLKLVEQWISQDRRGTLTVIADTNGPTEEEIHASLIAENYAVLLSTLAYIDRAQHREVSYEVHWRGRRGENRSPSFLRELAGHPGVLRLDWKPLTQ